MPWRGPAEAGEFPTLGHLVLDWIEANCAVPDGDHVGEEFLPTAEQQRFILWHYRLDPESGAFKFRRSMLVRPQKWGKGPLSAAIICAEAAGPVLFDGWDEKGDPVGRPWTTPHVQVTAVSEDQTDNVFRALLPMIELGAIAADVPDTGLTRVNLPGGGLIEPVTASARSRLGQRVTFVVQDETHSWVERNGGVKLAFTQGRNLSGMKGRSIETTNAWDPTEESVAQQSHRAASKLGDIFVDMAQPPEGTSLRRKKDRPRIFSAVYRDSWWISRERISAEVDELIERGEEAQAERFFANRIIAGADHAFDLNAWKACYRPRPEMAPGSLITLGFDGARFRDATALVATHVESGYQWSLGLWENSSADDWEVPEEEVHAAVDQAFDQWEVWRLYADPPYWESAVDAWAGKYGTERVFKWWTNRVKAMAYALRSYSQSIIVGELSHDGSPDMERHIANARRKPRPGIIDEEGRPMWTIEKDRPGSPDKIDGAMAGCLAWEARGDAIASGAMTRRRRRVVMA